MKLYICENVKTAKWRKSISDNKKLSLAFAKKCICDFIDEKERDIKIAISKNEYGKPFVQEIRKTCKTPEKIEVKMDISVHFSLSHSENMMVCAVACFNMGADCQKMSLEDPEKCKKLAGRYYSKEENAFLDSIPSDGDYIENFFEIWTKKEAYIKYTGKGLAEGLDTFSVADESGQKSHLGEVCFKKISPDNPKKNNFHIYLCYNRENKNILQVKYF